MERSPRMSRVRVRGWVWWRGCREAVSYAGRLQRSSLHAAMAPPPSFGEDEHEAYGAPLRKREGGGVRSRRMEFGRPRMAKSRGVERRRWSSAGFGGRSKSLLSRAAGEEILSELSR